MREKISQATEWLKKWALVIVSGIAVAFYALAQRRGQRVGELENEVTKEKLVNELGNVMDDAAKSKEKADEARKADEEIRSQRADLLKRYGIDPSEGG